MGMVKQAETAGIPPVPLGPNEQAWKKMAAKKKAATKTATKAKAKTKAKPAKKKAKKKK